MRSAGMPAVAEKAVPILVGKMGARSPGGATVPLRWRAKGGNLDHQPTCFGIRRTMGPIAGAHLSYFLILSDQTPAGKVRGTLSSEAEAEAVPVDRGG